MKPLRSLADIRALEALPYETQVPARSPVGPIARTAALFPQRDALVFLPSGDIDTPPERVTYAQLLERIRRAANLFRSLGVGAGDAVAILALQPDHIAALLRAT